MKEFREINTSELYASPFEVIGKDWLLITVPDGEKESGANAMTASWGGLGVLWNKPVATIYVRPQRHTYSLCENTDRFSLCVLPNAMRDSLKLCGTRSGKDTDKLKECSLTTLDVDGVKVIEQSRLVFICKKAYADFIKKEGFVDKDHLKHYPADDFHRVYILEIEKILVKD